MGAEVGDTCLPQDQRPLLLPFKARVAIATDATKHVSLGLNLAGDAFGRTGTHVAIRSAPRPTLPPGTASLLFWL